MRVVFLLPFLGATLVGQNDTPPDAIHQKEIITRISQVALRYQGHLPDFSCTQLTDRSRDDSGTGDHWKHQDTLDEALGYSNGQAIFKLVKINGKPPGRLHLLQNGLGSQGVLSAALVPTHVFDARVHARFTWLKEEVRQGKRLWVFSYEVPPFLKIKNGSKEVKVGFHGTFTADPDTGMILTRHQVMDSPPETPQYVTDIEYGPVSLSGQELFLPVKASENVRDGKHLERNEIQFVNYRKYSADAAVTYGDSK